APASRRATRPPAVHLARPVRPARRTGRARFSRKTGRIRVAPPAPACDGRGMRAYDTVVLGLGGMGSAALAHLALRGGRVLGCEQFQPTHQRGSSHGRTRVIRQAYFEDPAYVPLLLRAYELWEDLERARSTKLLVRTGAVMVGREDGTVVPGSARSAEE